MPILPRISALLLLGLIAMSSQSAWAHRFGVVLLAPLSGQQAESGKAFIDGFALATREQDGHASEESDGHLGGLDSYLYPLDSKMSAAALDKQLIRLLAREQPTFLSGSFNGTTEKQIQGLSRLEGLVVFNPENSRLWTTAQTRPDSLTMINGKPFASGFERRYNYAPDQNAYRGYIAARLISSTVRTLDQNPAQDINTTRTALLEALTN